MQTNKTTTETSVARMVRRCGHFTITDERGDIHAATLEFIQDQRIRSSALAVGRENTNPVLLRYSMAELVAALEVGGRIPEGLIRFESPEWSKEIEEARKSELKQRDRCREYLLRELSQGEQVPMQP